MSKVTLGTSVTVTGTHRWSTFQEAFEENPALLEVNYLQHPHHHEFTFSVEVSVGSYDREVEFIMLRRRILQAIEESVASGKHGMAYDFGSQSCEMMAERLYGALLDDYDVFGIKSTTVSEDGVSYARYER